MTNEQFETLAMYEKNMDTALRNRWAMNPGTPGLKRIHAVLDAINGTKTHVQYFCAACVLRLLRDAGKLYFAEKEAREAAAKAAEKPAETAVASDSAPAKPKAKKSTAKKPKTQKTAS